MAVFSAQIGIVGAFLVITVLNPVNGVLNGGEAEVDANNIFTADRFI